MSRKTHDNVGPQVLELEKRESRLKEVFKKQVSNFREACFCLFGYRVDMASQVGRSTSYCWTSSFVLLSSVSLRANLGMLGAGHSEGSVLPHIFLLKEDFCGFRRQLRVVGRLPRLLC